MTKERQATPWGYSSVPDPERWEHGGSREEAIAEGRQHFGDAATFWITQGVYSAPGSFMPRSGNVIDGMCDYAMDNGAPDDGEYPDVGKEGRDELDALLKAWAEKWAQPKWWTAHGEPIEVKPLTKTEENH